MKRPANRPNTGRSKQCKFDTTPDRYKAAKVAATADDESFSRWMDMLLERELATRLMLGMIAAGRVTDAEALAESAAEAFGLYDPRDDSDDQEPEDWLKPLAEKLMSEARTDD